MSTIHYAEEVGNWLDTLAPWDFWATFTYRYPPSLPAVRRSIERFSAEVSPSLMFWGSESGACTGRNHVHALLHFGKPDLGFVAPVSAHALWSVAFRRFGRSHVDAFEPERGASHYVAKYVSKQI